MDRLVSSDSISPEIGSESSLRPLSLDEYTGQEKIKKTLKIYIDAAKARNDVLDHLIFYGPPGLGKTTLSYIIAKEMGVGIKITSGPAMEHQGDLVSILSNLSNGDCLFIDEIHRLSPVVEEVLYPAMEDFKVDLVIGQGPAARTLRIDVPHFTMIGATTRVGLLTSPLRDRFGIVSRLSFYTEEELRQIVLRSAGLLNVSMDNEGALEIARRSRGTPRIANRLLKRVRDFAQVKGDGVINAKMAQDSLSLMEIDEKGFDEMDRLFLSTIIHKFSGGPVGIETISATINEDKDTLEDVYEPYLIQKGFIAKTPRGRVATRLAYKHLNVPAPGGILY